MVGYFSSTGRQASREIQSGRLQLKDIRTTLITNFIAITEVLSNLLQIIQFTKQENQWDHNKELYCNSRWR